MALTKILARLWTIEINTGTVATPTWVAIGGVTAFTFDHTKNNVDTTDFDSAGDQEHQVASRVRAISVDGQHKEDTGDGSRDAGQEAVEAANKLFGDAALKQFRLTTPGGTTYTMLGSVNLKSIGGGTDDVTSWGFDLDVSGAITEA